MLISESRSLIEFASRRMIVNRNLIVKRVARDFQTLPSLLTRTSWASTKASFPRSWPLLNLKNSRSAQPNFRNTPPTKEGHPSMALTHRCHNHRTAPIFLAADPKLQTLAFVSSRNASRPHPSQHLAKEVILAAASPRALRRETERERERKRQR